VMPFGLWARTGPGNLDEGPDPPWEGAILGERGAHCKVQGLSAMGCAQMAELIDFHLVCGLMWAKGSEGSMAFARWRQCAHMGGHIGPTWRI